MDNRLLAERNHQAKGLVEAISGDVREHQGAQENTLVLFQDEYSSEHRTSPTRIAALEGRSQSMQERMVT
eukprot:5548077-Prorocentrum_lima.AAC.1